MKYGAWLQNGYRFDARTCVDLAVAAEEGGWDGVFVSQNLRDGYTDPWTVLAAIAARTERIALGTWIALVPDHQPWRLASTLATLDQLSDGRVLFGAGLGARYEYDAFGGSYDRKLLAERYDEALDVITRLWTGEPVDHDGPHYTLRGAQLKVLPVQQPRIPILAAGWWPAKPPLRRGARWDGIMPNWPAMMGDQEGPEGQKPTGASVADEFRDLMGYYLEQTDDPGEVVAPAIRDEDYLSSCEELGVTWLMTGRFETPDDLRAGPPELI